MWTSVKNSVNTHADIVTERKEKRKHRKKNQTKSRSNRVEREKRKGIFNQW